jgi:glycerol-3-phosphate cytidylyltransferase
MAILGFTASAFDLIHAGHISMLEEAASLCDTLICGLHVDPSTERVEKSKPVQPLSERYIQLSAIKYVGRIIPYQTEEELLQIIALVRPNIRFLGEEYRDKAFTGRELCESLGVKIHYNSRRHGLSSTLQRARLAHAYPDHRT